MGQDGRLITPPPTIEQNRNQNVIILKNSGAIYMDYLVENDMEGKDSIGVLEKEAEDKGSIGILAGPQLTPLGATIISSMMVNKSSNKKQKLNELKSIGSVLLNDNDYPGSIETEIFSVLKEIGVELIASMGGF